MAAPQHALRLMMRAALALLLALLFASPAAAHTLRVFARIDGGTVSGYGFFVGGGRPHSAAWTATMADAPLAAGETDAEGRFTFPMPHPVTGDVRVVVDTREGHIASATLPAGRFGPDGLAAPEAPVTNDAVEGGKSAPVSPPAGEIAAMVDAAVSRQVAPLLERIEAMDARRHFTDILSGLFLIMGLAGAGLWALGRRR